MLTNHFDVYNLSFPSPGFILGISPMTDDKKKSNLFSLHKDTHLTPQNSDH